MLWMNPSQETSSPGGASQSTELIPDEPVLEMQHSITITTLLNDLVCVFLSYTIHNGLLVERLLKHIIKQCDSLQKTLQNFWEQTREHTQFKGDQIHFAFYIFSVFNRTVVFPFVCFLKLCGQQCYMLLKSWHILSQTRGELSWYVTSPKNTSQWKVIHKHNYQLSHFTERLMDSFQCFAPCSHFHRCKIYLLHFH